MTMILLKIGCETLLLPNDAGVAPILKALSKGVSCSDYTFQGEVHIRTERTLEVSMKVVPTKTKFVDPDRKLTPEEQGYVKLKPKRLGQGLLLLEGGSNAQ